MGNNDCGLPLAWLRLCQLASQFSFSLCPILLALLLFHKVSFLTHILNSKLHLSICFQRTQPATNGLPYVLSCPRHPSFQGHSIIHYFMANTHFPGLSWLVGPKLNWSQSTFTRTCYLTNSFWEKMSFSLYITRVFAEVFFLSINLLKSGVISLFFFSFYPQQVIEYTYQEELNYLMFT